MSFTPNTSKPSNTEASSYANKSKVIAYANNYVAGLKGGRKKIGAIKMYENNALASFLKENASAIGGKLTIEVEVVFLETADLEFEVSEELTVA
jgi:hypothetical protein